MMEPINAVNAMKDIISTIMSVINVMKAALVVMNLENAKKHLYE